jgi:hypothetical protein
MRPTIVLSISHDQCLLEVFSAPSDVGARPKLQRIHAFLVGQPSNRSQPAWVQSVPVNVPHESEQLSRLLIENLHALGQKLDLPLKACSLEVLLGATYAHVGCFQMQTAADSHPSESDINSYAQAWARQAWGLEAGEQQLKVQLFKQPHHYLLSCVENRILQAIQTLSQSVGLRLTKIMPVVLHTLETWSMAESAQNSTPSDSDKPQLPVVHCLLEPGLPGTGALGSNQAQLTLTQAGQLLGMARVWVRGGASPTAKQDELAGLARRLMAEHSLWCGLRLDVQNWPLASMGAAV